MELIHIANATFPIELSFNKETISLENLASKQKLSGFLKSTKKLVCREFGGASRDRTGDLLVANQALSQLSYGPSLMVGLGGVAPPTSPLSGVRSN